MTALEELFDEAAWLEWRRGGVGASDIGAVAGLSDWGSPFTVWCQKVGLVDPGPVTERMRIGRALEDALADLFTERTGLYVSGAQSMVAHPQDQWIRATVDGLVSESPTSPTSDLLGGVEFKTAGTFGWRDGIPPAYRAQCQWSMLATGLETWWLAVLFAGFRFQVEEVQADRAQQAHLYAIGGEFWHDHVLAKEPPPLDGSKATTDALNDLYPHSAVDLEAAATVPSALIREWRFAVADAKQARLEVDVYANRIKAALKGATEGFDEGGNRVVSWRPVTVKEHVRRESSTRRLIYHGGDVDA